jgi:large subunit ribosomal protein L22
MTGTKTNEQPGTKAVLHYCHISAFKVRPVLDIIRGKDVADARDILRFSERDAAIVVGKLLDSAVANAAHNDELDPEELYVSACFADEGMTHKRWRPRARGRATRIRKRTSHLTIIVSRLPEDRLQRLRAKRQAETSNRRARRVAAGRTGRRTRRDEQLPGTTEPVLADPGDTVEQSIAEQDAVEAETTEALPAEEAGIVDQQEAAVEAAAEAVESDESAVSAEAAAASAVDQSSDQAEAATTEAEAESAEKEEGE